MTIIQGRFGPGGEWIFEIELVTSDGEPIAVDAVFDSGFSNGYLALNAADVSALGWRLLQPDVELATANGLSRFDIYQGKVIIGGKTCVIPVHVGRGIPDILLGLRWQNQARITVDYRAGILTLELEA